MKVYKMKCYVCNKSVERNRKSDKAICFNCNKERVRDYSYKYYINHKDEPQRKCGMDNVQ